MATTSKIAMIKRPDLISVIAEKTKMKVEDVDKIERALPNAFVSLAKEKFEGGATTVIAETSIAAIKCQYHDKGEKKNADGSVTKIGPNISVAYGTPNNMLKELQTAANLVGKVAKAAPGIVKMVSAAAKLAA